MINSNIAGIYAVGNSYPNSDDSDGTLPSEVAGVLNIIGHNRSYDGNMPFSESPNSYGFPAAAPIYNIDSGIIEKIYQRYRIVESESEYEDFVIMAIHGGFAICGEVSDFGTFNKIVVSPYHSDSTLQETPQWIASSTLELYTEIGSISIYSDFVVVNVVIIKPGKFALVTRLLNERTYYNVYIVEYTTILDGTANAVAIDLLDYGIDNVDFEFSTRCIRICVDPVTFEIGVSLQINEVATGIKGSLVVKVDTDALTVDPTFILDYDFGDVEPINIFTSPDETFLNFGQSSYYYRNTHLSFGGIKLGGYSDSYGALIEYQEYTSRTLTADEDLSITYVDIGEIINIDSGDKINAKLTALGLNPTGDPIIGGVSAFIS